jgi:hypothetical protein
MIVAATITEQGVYIHPSALRLLIQEYGEGEFDIRVLPTDTTNAQYRYLFGVLAPILMHYYQQTGNYIYDQREAVSAFQQAVSHVQYGVDPETGEVLDGKPRSISTGNISKKELSLLTLNIVQFLTEAGYEIQTP